MTRRLVAAVAVLILAAGLAGGAGAEEPVTVFAAASLTDALRDVSAAWARAGHPAPKLAFASSSTLARQIEQGAPADLFASADEQWMDYLARADLLAPGTRADVVRNSLVLVVPADRARRVAIDKDLDLDALLGADGRLATGDPAHVPAGIYARQAFTKLGLWERVQPRLAGAEDVRSALRLVERGEAPAGVVYATDAQASAGVVVAGIFPDDTHDPIVYPFALVRGHDTAGARALLAYLRGPEAAAMFAARGFK